MKSVLRGRFFFSFLGGLCFALSSFADQPIGLFFESAANYEFNDSTISYPAPVGNLRNIIKGRGVAGRLGYQLNELFFFGADCRYSRPKLRDDVRALDSTVNSLNWGPIAGWQVPLIHLRIWSGWIAGGSLSPDAKSEFGLKSKSAGGWRLGMGLKVSSVSLNFEYQHLKYVDLESQFGPLAASYLPGSRSDLLNKSYVVSASFPIF